MKTARHGQPGEQNHPAPQRTRFIVAGTSQTFLRQASSDTVFSDDVSEIRHGLR
jgi:hypothetical protein